LTCDDPHDPQPLQAAHDVLDGCDRPAQAHLMPNRAKAICWALSQAQPDDAVLLVGPHNLKPRLGHPTSSPEYGLDADVARYWLYRIEAKQACPWVPV
jgi:hypothetical protein